VKYQLVPVSEQVIVITGASSGIGLVTAKRAAHRGARVVLAARSENDLRTACDDIRRDGGRAIFVVADVTNPDDVRKIGETAISEFGRIDTWINNATEHEYGSREALRHLRERGGALVNVAGDLADRAVSAFTDAMRMEVEKEGIPIRVSLVTPKPVSERASDTILRCAEMPAFALMHPLTALALLACAVTFLGFATLKGYARS
jgi:NADP-dependent 3-hydroxy acid dehydrogenase YdfG